MDDRLHGQRAIRERRDRLTSSAGLLDELHVVVLPVLVVGGERLFEDLPDLPARYTCAEFAGSDRVAHVRITRRA